MAPNDKSNAKRKKSSKRRCVRKFHGNQFVQLKSKIKEKTALTKCANQQNEDQEIDVHIEEPEVAEEAVPEEPVVEEPVAGPSRRKICPEPTQNMPTKDNDGFRIIESNILQVLIRQSCICAHCNVGRVSLHEDSSRKMGLATLIYIRCESCGNISETYSSSVCKRSKAYEINRRAVLAMSETGGGWTTLQKICGLLNMPPPMTSESYADTLRALKNALEHVVDESMQKAASEEHDAAGEEQDKIAECNTMFDGTWRKRGFSSLQGGVTAISPITGKCIDYEMLNRACPGCARWKSKPDSPAKQNWQAGHKCSINFQGSAPAMEPEAVKRIFNRSEEKNHLQYTGYIGDGDSKSFNMVKASEPYADKNMKKLECVGHVQKRMGTALRKLKSKHGSKKLDDGKSIGGQGRLTAVRIDKLQVYYGLAIRRHKEDLEGMQKEVWAGLYHSTSTDEKPQHQFCPDGQDTWCKFKIAAREEKDFHHKDPLPEAVFHVIKPAYDRLCKTEILEGCLGGYTQNNCEALNHLIWARCPKSKYSGRDHLDSAAAGAVLVFNDGLAALSRVLRRLGIEPGAYTQKALKRLDKKRIRESDLHASIIQKKVRKSKRKTKKSLEENAVTAEGITYSSGAF